MFSYRRPETSSLRGVATACAMILLSALAVEMPMKAQQGPPLLPSCVPAPSPETDRWPVAATDTLGVISSAVTFTSDALLGNDTASTPLTILAVGPTSYHGGTITGTGPYTYTPAPAFVGEDVFTYEISDTLNETTVGIVKVRIVVAAADITPPSVSIASPTGGIVFGDVLITASALDNVGVAGVRFFDGASPIGAEVTASPFRVTWSTGVVPEGIHTLTAVARDAANNSTTSAAVTVTVANTVTVPNVVGSTDAAARSAIIGAGLTVGTVTSATNATVPAGQVISQTPAGGGSAARNSAVSYVLSLGAATAAVPGVVGLTQAAAQTAITSAGFAVGGVTTANSATVAAGLVISQTPTADTTAVLGSSVALVVSLGPAAPPAADGLVLALGFDEASGTVATDSSASAKNGTIRQAARVAGKFGGALQFDGVDDWVTVADTTASPLDLTTGMTLEAWVNPTVMSGWETVLMKERGIAGEGLLSYALYAHDGAPLSLGRAVPAGYVRVAPVASTTDRAVRGTTKLALNTWTHLATTYDGTNQRFYVNGVLVGTTAGTGSIAVSNGAIRIGGNASSTGEFFQGLIDEVRVYNRALTAVEITRDMTTPIR
jgi:hypothetical protein